MNEVIIYTSEENQSQIEVIFENDTLWLSLKQIADLFERDKSVISRHLKNIFSTNELNRSSVVAKNATTATDGKTYLVEFYNLDAIISVGYRVNSIRGTKFRQWATQRLKDYLVSGYALNEKRLLELNYKYTDLQNAIKLAASTGNNENLSSLEAQGILKVIEQYAYALETLDNYDHQKLSIESHSTEKQIHKLSYDEAIKQINIWKDFQKAGKLFGNEKDQSFKSSLETIYQTFDEKDLYPTLEEKAANLLYYIAKNHSFTDGNKRIAAGLFVYFLDLNNKLLNESGNKRIADNALVAITIMIAESKSEEKEMMIKLVVNLINHKN